jgi:hypothetical protein
MWQWMKRDGSIAGCLRSDIVDLIYLQTPAARSPDWSSYSTQTTLGKAGALVLTTSLYQVKYLGITATSDYLKMIDRKF